MPVVRDSLGALLDVPGVFVFGSNDYFSPTLRNPLRYLLPGRRPPQHPLGAAAVARPARRLHRLRLGRPHQPARGGEGRRAVLRVRRRRRPAPALRPARRRRRPGRPRAPTSGSGSRTRRTSGCSTSSPRDGYDAILAGHTHGGQVCLPGVGALTTNCDLEPARAKGLHRHPAASRDGDPGSAWLHVSAGIGTSPYARIRVACRPEATLLTLVAEAPR